MLTLLLLVASLTDPADPQPAAWIERATITLFQFEASRAEPGGKGFAMFKERCRQALTVRDQKALLTFLLRVNRRELKDAEEARREGKVGGGVPGCVGFEYGIRFVTADRTVDAFFCPSCGWAFAAERPREGPDPIRFVFTPVEVKWLTAFMSSHVRCGAAGGCT
jgi:hypothetical protein